MDLIQRPPIGFIVEGLTEYQCYPTLVTKMLGTTVHIPLLNAKGIQKIVSQLEMFLERLVRAYHPHTVIIGLDARDLLRRDSGKTCRALRESLQERASQWLENEHNAKRFSPMPERIVVVFQFPTFESWLIADIAGLGASQDVIALRSDDTILANADAEIGNPGDWLSQRTLPGVSLKPTGAKRIVRNLSPAQIAAKSRSFRKLAKEINSAYAAWSLACGFACPSE